MSLVRKSTVRYMLLHKLTQHYLAGGTLVLACGARTHMKTLIRCFDVFVLHEGPHCSFYPGHDERDC